MKVLRNAPYLLTLGINVTYFCSTLPSNSLTNIDSLLTFTDYPRPKLG